MPLAHVLQILAVLIAAVALGLNAWELHQATRQRRTKEVADAVRRLHDDQELREVYYKFEYSQ